MFQSICDIVDEHCETKETVARWIYPEKENKVLPEILLKSYDLSAALRAAGIEKGDRVAVILENSISYASLLIAIWSLGAIAVPMKTKTSPFSNIETFVFSCNEVCSFKCLIVEENNVLLTTNIQHFNETLTTVLTVDDLEQFEFSTFLSNQENCRVSLSGKDIAIIQFSSGSTGKPKGVIVTHEMMMNQLENLSKKSGLFIDGDKSLASWLPFHHDMGLFIGVLLPLFLGCNNYICSPQYYIRNPLQWFKLLSDKKVNGTMTTSSALSIFLNSFDGMFIDHDKIAHPFDGSLDFGELHIVLGAEKVNAKVVKRSIDILSVYGLKECQIHTGYGMAEATLGITCSVDTPLHGHFFKFIDETTLEPADENDLNTLELVPLGDPYDMHELFIFDQNEHEVDDLIVGEIYIRGPSISPGYYNNLEETSFVFKNGGFMTGDLGFKHDGEIYFLSRKDDVAVIGGRNVVPDDIELAIESLGVCRTGNTCFFAYENEKGQSEAIVLVGINARTPKSHMENIRSKIVKHVYREQQVVLSRVVFCSKNEIEKTSSGKKRRKVIKTRFSNNQIKDLSKYVISTT